ncbi:MAG: 50S ribosomal protein L11 methyltransferase [Notoacmeibacter sp.]|nr:50S ribosomal protein L11 methyltransferase [Notoacmeibacter sp.]MCC0032065.1 50S ribosomal protein L11 methyltransferase [Brucellaceae bacterium]
MTQTRLFFNTGKLAAARASDLLELAFEDEACPIASFEVDEDADIHEVSLYAEEDGVDDAARRMAAVLAGAGITAEIEREKLPDIDWIAKSLEGLKPLRAGRFIVHGSHDRDRVRIGDLAIEIDAGQAFGTGHHGTTAGCLEMMEEVVRRERPRKALDLGTGSAVLAIALARLARIPVLATDIDPVATRVANANVRLNGQHRLVTCITATGFRHAGIGLSKPFDLIVANILARPLMRLAPQMARHLRPGGSVILSGILASQRDAVIAAYAGQRFAHRKTIWREGWVTIHLTR